jgi:hypothetical protein
MKGWKDSLGGRVGWGLKCREFGIEPAGASLCDYV